MNKQAINAIRNRGQGGFTLIELIVVIVILGILAATAMPRFMDMGGDARRAALAGVRGSLESTTAMIRARFLLAPTQPVTVEGLVVPIAQVGGVDTGYPAAANALLSAAGIGVAGQDFTIIQPGTGDGTTAPAMPAGTIGVVPNSVAGTARAVTCFVSYAQPAALNTAPVITINTNTCP